MKYVVSYLVLYAVTLGLLAHYEHFDISEPLFILAIVGGGFTLVAWLLTRRAVPLPVAEPRRGVVWYLVVIAVFTTWGLGAIALAQPWHDVAVIASKLAMFVAIPWMLFDRTIWSRTRNLLIVVIIHGAGDLLPGVVKLSKHFSLT